MPDTQSETLYRTATTEEDGSDVPDGLTLSDMEDLQNLTLHDIATGESSTGFIFKRNDGSLTGFQVPLPPEGITRAEFKVENKDESSEVSSE